MAESDKILGHTGNSKANLPTITVDHRISRRRASSTQVRTSSETGLSTNQKSDLQRFIGHFQVGVPIFNEAGFDDTQLYEIPAKPEGRFFLPRYQVAEETVGGHKRFKVTLNQDKLVVYLEPFRAPQLKNLKPNHPIEFLPHDVAVHLEFIEDGKLIIKQFNEISYGMDGKNLRAVYRIDRLEEQDQIYNAISDRSFKAKLIVSRSLKKAIQTVINRPVLKFIKSDTQGVLVSSFADFSSPISQNYATGIHVPTAQQSFVETGTLAFWFLHQFEADTPSRIQLFLRFNPVHHFLIEISSGEFVFSGGYKNFHYPNIPHSEHWSHMGISWEEYGLIHFYFNGTLIGSVDQRTEIKEVDKGDPYRSAIDFQFSIEDALIEIPAGQPNGAMTRTQLEHEFKFCPEAKAYGPPSNLDFTRSLYWRYLGHGPDGNLNLHNGRLIPSGTFTRDRLEEKFRTCPEARAYGPPSNRDFTISLYWRYLGHGPDGNLEHHTNRLLPNRKIANRYQHISTSFIRDIILLRGSAQLADMLVDWETVNRNNPNLLTFIPVSAQFQAQSNLYMHIQDGAFHSTAIYRYQEELITIDEIADNTFSFSPSKYRYIFDDEEQDLGQISLLRRVVQDDQGIFTYYQDDRDRNLFYYLPDRFALGYEGEKPLISLTYYSTGDMSIEELTAELSFVAKPHIDTARLERHAQQALPNFAVQTGKIKLSPLFDNPHTTYLLQIGSESSHHPRSVSLKNGITDAVTMSNQDFANVWADLFSSSQLNTLLTGTVYVELQPGLREAIPLLIRFSEGSDQQKVFDAIFADDRISTFKQTVTIETFEFEEEKETDVRAFVVDFGHKSIQLKKGETTGKVDLLLPLRETILNTVDAGFYEYELKVVLSSGEQKRFPKQRSNDEFLYILNPSKS